MDALEDNHSMYYHQKMYRCSIWQDHEDDKPYSTVFCFQGQRSKFKVTMNKETRKKL